MVRSLRLNASTSKAQWPSTEFWIWHLYRRLTNSMRIFRMDLVCWNAEELAKFDDALGGNSTDPTCLRELDEDINQNEVVIRLFLEGRKIGSLGPHILGKLPLDYLPQEFTIKDACMTNAGFIWFHKHFYM
jgi:hypothetical protein